MIWLASFPRSGNTFARNVLFEVYGLESTEVNQKVFRFSSTYQEYPVVKTHLLPEDLESIKPSDIIIYLVRDGRDALVSIAHHRTNIIEPGSDVQENLKLAVEAQKGSYFGGWDRNAAEWMARAHLVIRFEDLIGDPVKEFEKLRAFYPDLPQPRMSSIPTFESQKKGDPKYGPPRKKGLFFRKGEVGDWKNTMGADLENIFWKKSGDVMSLLGYESSGDVGEFVWDEQTRKKARELAKKKKGLLNKITRFLSRGSTFINYPGHTWDINPKMIYLSAIQSEDPFIHFIRKNVPDDRIVKLLVSVNGSLSFEHLSGKKVSDPENTIEVLISEVSMHYLRQTIHLRDSTTIVSGLLDPVEHVVRMYFHQNREVGVNDLVDNQEFEGFCKEFEYRNTQSRVLSKFTEKVDYVWTPDNYSNVIHTLSAKLDWVPEDHRFDHYKVPSSLIDEISRYNRRDIDMYQFYNQKLFDHEKDPA